MLFDTVGLNQKLIKNKLDNSVAKAKRGEDGQVKVGKGGGGDEGSLQ